MRTAAQAVDGRGRAVDQVSNVAVWHVACGQSGRDDRGRDERK